jgi:hypothetical protein
MTYYTLTFTSLVNSVIKKGEISGDQNELMMPYKKSSHSYSLVVLSAAETVTSQILVTI